MVRRSTVREPARRSRWWLSCCISTLGAPLLCAVLLLPALSAQAASGLASASANTLWVAVAETTLQSTGAPVAKALRTGLWLDVDSGARAGQRGLTWGARLGWTGVGPSRSDAIAASGIGGAARVGVARSVWAWNRGWPGELLVTADVWSAYDAARWYTTGLRMAPRIGVRILLGYGGAVRARVRFDVAPAMAVSSKAASTEAGFDTHLSGAWLRLGLDIGPITVGGWGHVATGQGPPGVATGSIRDVSVGLALGLRMDRGGQR